jgi:hypothetical protein
MKKFAVIAVALVVAFMMAVPAGALEISTNGYYRARWLAAYNAFMSDDNDNGNSYGDMRLRVNNDIKVNDNLTLRTRFRALNGRQWGDQDEAGGNADNFDWERAWITATFNFGRLEVGRRQGGTWGTAFADTEVDADRIQLTMPVGPLTMIAIFQKTAERDGGDVFGDGYLTEDTDADTFYLAGNWTSENIAAGVLFAYTDDARASDLAPGTAAVPAARFWATPMSLLPYFTAKFGPFGLQGEARYDFGTARDWVEDSAGSDVDFDAWAFNLEGTFDFGMGVAQLGYAWVSGQERPSFPGDTVDVTAGQIGVDWVKLAILTGDTGPQPAYLGGFGGYGEGGNTDGLSLIYAGADFKPMENLMVGFVAGFASADETDAGQDDDLGWEVNLTAKYTIFDNLSNNFVVGYLDGGDYWEGSRYDPGYNARSEDFDGEVWVFQNTFQLNF